VTLIAFDIPDIVLLTKGLFDTKMKIMISASFGKNQDYRGRIVREEILVYIYILNQTYAVPPVMIYIFQTGCIISNT